ncbi:MAG: FtsX-like permease family protein [Flavobacteriales bacterium]
MIWKLQKKTLLPLQIFGYGITLFIGITISLITLTAYTDISPILYSESDVFNDKSVIVSKKISIIKTLDKERIYFTNEELKEIENKDFVKEVSKFNKATNYKIFLSSDMFGFGSDLFFESVPDKFLDVDSEKWEWEEGSDFVPIMMPEDYLQLYNLGFAESQGLPLLSKKTVSLASFNIRLTGVNKSKKFKSSIVGFSSKINSILVPEDFLKWANKEFGNYEESKTSRILVEFSNPNDESIIEFFKKNNYEVNQDKLEKNKLIFFFKLSFLFVFLISIIIVILSIGFVILSVNLIFQKNKDILINLYNIGFSLKQITFFYKLIISMVTAISILLSLISSLWIRNLYSAKLISYFDIEVSNSVLFISSISLLIVLLILLNFMIVKRIKNILVS